MAAHDAWLKRHAAGELILNRELNRFFAGQTKRIIEKLGDIRSPVPSDVTGLYDDTDETAALLAVVSRPIIVMMGAGAAAALAAGKKRKGGRKDFDVEALDDFELSEVATQAIKDNYEILEAADYWRDIQHGTKAQLTQILEKAVHDGLSGPQIAKLVNTALGGFQKVRAKAIARTETTSAYNSGTQAGYDSLLDEGVAFEKEWLVVSDEDLRRSHSEMGGKKVAGGGNFSLGGVEVPYPGHPSLPARERVNCRCTTGAVFDLS